MSNPEKREFELTKSDGEEEQPRENVKKVRSDEAGEVEREPELTKSAEEEEHSRKNVEKKRSDATGNCDGEEEQPSKGEETEMRRELELQKNEEKEKQRLKDAEFPLVPTFEDKFRARHSSMDYDFMMRYQFFFQQRYDKWAKSVQRNAIQVCENPMMYYHRDYDAIAAGKCCRKNKYN